MKRFIFPMLMMVFVQPLPAVAQPPRQDRVPPLAASIADGVPFVVQLNPGETNGSLIGGESYSGNYNRDSRTFTVTGMGYAEDGTVTKMTSSWGGANPRQQEITLWGAMYRFDARGNVFLGTSSSGRLTGKLVLSSAAIADGVPFVVQLNPGETNGSLIGGESYSGQYNRDSRTFTVTGMGYAEDGTVTQMTSSWGGANPRQQEITLWGAMYRFDARGNVFLGTSSAGRLSGKLVLRK